MNKFILLILSISTIYAQNDALEAFKKHNYPKAFKLYTIEAKAGESTSQNALSYLYFNGIGTKKEKQKGLYWLKKSAHNMNAVAQYDLAMMYLVGNNVKKDLKLALTWLDSSSDLGNRDAQYNLALMYYNGDSTDQNVTKAAELLEKAALQNHKKAKKNVGRVYMQLLKFDKALKWLELNAKEQDTGAYSLLSEIYCEKEQYIKAKKYAKLAIKSGNDNVTECLQTTSTDLSAQQHDQQ